VWTYVIPHFTAFLSNLELTLSQREDALTKVESVGKCLHARYYDGPYDPRRVVVVGSYGKGTAVRPPSDIDMLYLLPVSEYHRVNQLSWNGQSQLLQEVKRALVDSFPRTDLSADGQVVQAPFASYAVEVVPAFLCDDGTHITCNTASGGSWRSTNPVAECRAISELDAFYGNKATHLIKMMKAWKRNCSVPLKSIALEVVACSFVRQWPHNQQSIFYYDWMVRDFFAFLGQHKNVTAQIPGIHETIDLGDEWVSRCESAYGRAAKASDYEYHDWWKPGEMEWEKIFGNQFPRTY
jgi:hypothetical protein